MNFATTHSHQSQHGTNVAFCRAMTPPEQIETGKVDRFTVFDLWWGPEKISARPGDTVTLFPTPLGIMVEKVERRDTVERVTPDMERAA